MLIKTDKYEILISRDCEILVRNRGTAVNFNYYSLIISKERRCYGKKIPNGTVDYLGWLDRDGSGLNDEINLFLDCSRLRVKNNNEVMTTYSLEGNIWVPDNPLKDEYSWLYLLYQQPHATRLPKIINSTQNILGDLVSIDDILLGDGYLNKLLDSDRMRSLI